MCNYTSNLKSKKYCEMHVHTFLSGAVCSLSTLNWGQSFPPRPVPVRTSLFFGNSDAKIIPKRNLRKYVMSP